MASTKLALPQEETTQRRKSMRISQPSDRKEDLFELEDVQLPIGSCKIDPESASGSERLGHRCLRRSSLGRPLRQAMERVATYKEVPLNIKLRRS
ncbi:shugoshin-1-like [Phragmites australis]|uniref:shugoshin-1-like n=1 Tax=Phragmites australis TaxID=29695 RepID=UPI002D77A0CF|nr:shugoshin-1-like [Phragmites australis]